MLKALQQYEIVYVTDEHIPPRNVDVYKVHTYHTPPIVFSGSAFAPSDPQQSPVMWAISHPLDARQIYAWAKMLGELVLDMEQRYRPDAVLLHFSLVASLMWAEKQHAQRHVGRDDVCSSTGTLIGSTPHVVLYMNPGVPNATIPWLFDSNLRNPTFRLYDPRNRCDVEKAWEVMLGRLSMRDGTSSLITVDDVRAMASSLRDMHHALLWDPAMIEPLRVLVPGMDTELLGALDTSKMSSPPVAAAHAPHRQKSRSTSVTAEPLAAQLPPNLRRFFEKNGGVSHARVAFISFGSVGKLKKLRDAAAVLARLIRQKLGMAVIFHDTAAASSSSSAKKNSNGSKLSAIPTTYNVDDENENENGKEEGNNAESSSTRTTRRRYEGRNKKMDAEREGDDFTVHQGHVPYDAIVPLLSLVVFAGSTCLHLTCLRNGVPMLFVPLTTEQYFWGKNYEHFTGVPYVDVDKPYVKAHQPSTAVAALANVRKAGKVGEYVRRVQDSMRRRDSHAALQSMVGRVIANAEKRDAKGGFLRADENGAAETKT